MPNPLLVALQGKGLATFLKRALAIGQRYGVTRAKMARALDAFAGLVMEFDGQASFPLTAWTLERTRGDWARYQELGVEFAIHGYYHVDHSQLSQAQHVAQLHEAQQVFAAHGLACTGFRAPYLRYSSETLAALDALGFSYDSSQGVAWDVLDGRETDAYRRALAFYRARPATDYVSVPRLVGTHGLVQIPYSLPDDEALVERLSPPSTLTDGASVDTIWVKVLRRTHALGELFTLGLHPERILPCAGALRAVLQAARALGAEVWVARLDEIAAWWRQRAAAEYHLEKLQAGVYRFTVQGPPGTVVLARNIAIEAPTAPWDAPYQRVLRDGFVVHAEQMPLIGLAPGVSAMLARFLKQQGYLLASADTARACAHYVDQQTFTLEDERPLLEALEGGSGPMLRLARWPSGARSALAVTGDIDALTLWDYGLRFLVNEGAIRDK